MQIPNKKYRFVFDLAGVLLKWQPERFYEDYFVDTPEHYDYFFSHVMSDDVQRDISIGKPFDEVLADCIKRHPDYADAINSWREHWHTMLVGEIEGSVAVISELRERGYKIFLLGNWARQEFDWALTRFTFLCEFDDVLLSGDCGLSKPDDAIFALAEKRFELTPADTIFIDDREDNVMAAIGRGWNGIIFESPRQLYRTLMDYGLL
jgi:2-haloacid dehalogenase